MVASWHVDLSCCEDFVTEMMPSSGCNSTVTHSFFLLHEKFFGVRFLLFIYLLFYIFYSMFVESFSDVLFCVACVMAVSMMSLSGSRRCCERCP